MMHISTLDKIREDWQSEHIKACEVLEPAAAGRSFPPRTWRVYLGRNVPPPYHRTPSLIELLEGKLEIRNFSGGGKELEGFPQTSSFCRVPALTVVSGSAPGLPLVFG